MKLSLSPFIFLLLSQFSLAANDGSFTIRSERLVLPQDEATSSISILKSDEISSSNELLENLELFTPGMNINTNGTFGASTSVQMRGTGRGYSQTNFDGLILKDATDIDQSFQKQLLPSSFIGGAEVMRGIQSGLYGSDAVGGVINLESSEGKNQVSAKAGSYDYLGLAGRIKLEKTKLLLDYSKASGPSAFNQAKQAFAEKDSYHSLAGYLAHSENLLSHQIFFKALFMEHDQEIDGGYPFADKVDNDLSSQAYRILAVGIKRNRAGPLQYKLQIQQTHVEKEILDTAYLGESETVQAEASYLFNKYLSAAIFSDFNHDQVKIEGEFTQKQIDNGSIGTSFHEKFGDTFASQTIRVDQHSRFGSQATYRLGLGHNITRSLSVRASYATGFKAPTLYQLYTSYGGNRELDPTKASGYDLSTKLEVNKTKAELSYFHTDLKSQIDYDLARSSYYNVARSEIRGIELTLSQEFTSLLAIKFNGTRLWTKNKLNGTKLLTRPDLTLATSFDFTPVEGQKISALIFYKGKRNDSTGEMPTYYTLSLSGEHQVSEDLSAFWKVRNILDRQYEDVRDYGTYERSFVVGVKRSL